jgi:hypothetical protein
MTSYTTAVAARDYDSTLVLYFTKNRADKRVSDEFVLRYERITREFNELQEELWRDFRPS